MWRGRPAAWLSLLSTIAFAACGKGLTTGAGLRNSGDAGVDTLVLGPPWKACGQFGSAGASRTAFSRDGKNVAVGYRNGVVALHSAADGSTVWTRPAHARPVWGLAFTNDDAHLVTAGEGIKILRRDGGALARSFGDVRFSADATAAASADGKRFVTANGDRVQLWSVDDGALLWTRTEDGPVRAVFLLSDGRVVSHAARMNVRSGMDGGPERGFALPEAYLAGVSPDGRSVIGEAVVDSRVATRVWSLEDGEVLWEIPGGSPGGIPIAGFSADGRLVVARSSSGGAAVWRLDDRTQLQAFARPGRLATTAFAPNSQDLLVMEMDATASVYETQAGTLRVDLATEIGHTTAGPADLALSDDGKLVAAMSPGPGGSLHVWSASDARFLYRLPAGVFANVGAAFAFSADSGTIAMAHGDGKVHVVNAADGTELRSFGTAVVYLDLTPAGVVLAGSTRATTATSTLRRYDASTGNELAPLGSAGDFTVSNVEASPDGTLAATLLLVRGVTLSSRVPILAMWRLIDGAQLWTNEEVYANTTFAFSADGTRLAVSTTTAGQAVAGDLMILGATDGALMRRAAAVVRERPGGLAFSPDGSLLFACSPDGTTIRRTTDLTAVVAPFGTACNALALSRDGARLIAVTTDYTIPAWCPP